MNIGSSSLWITYSQMVSDTPLFVRGISDLILFIISTLYIVYNRMNLPDNKYELKEEKWNTYNFISISITKQKNGLVVLFKFYG